MRWRVSAFPPDCNPVKDYLKADSESPINPLKMPIFILLKTEGFRFAESTGGRIPCPLIFQ